MFTPHKREVELLQKLRFPGVVELAVAVAVIVVVVVRRRLKAAAEIIKFVPKYCPTTTNTLLLRLKSLSQATNGLISTVNG